MIAANKPKLLSSFSRNSFNLISTIVASSLRFFKFFLLSESDVLAGWTRLFKGIMHVGIDSSGNDPVSSFADTVDGVELVK